MRFNEKILSWSILILFIVLGIISYKINWFIYFSYLINIILLLILLRNIISYKRICSYKEKKLSIKISHYKYIYYIFLIILLILNSHSIDTEESNIFILYIIIYIIYLPVEYKINAKIHFFEDGIFSAKIRNHETIPYSKIEKIKFIEYLRGKFLLEISLEPPFLIETNEYKIKQKDKDNIILFINSFIEKEKIIEIKEYKEDKLF